MDEQQLRSKKVGELREIAAAFGIADTGKMKKAEILEALLNSNKTNLKPLNNPFLQNLNRSRKTMIST